MKYSGKSTLPPQQLLCETDSWNVDIEMKYLIIWSPTTCQCTSRIFPSYNLFSNTANKLLIGSVRNQSGLIIDEKNVPHFMKAINPLTCDYNKGKNKTRYYHDF